MTGAGSATAAYALEDNFGEGPGTDAIWRQPGKNIQVNDLSAENALERVRDPDDPTPSGSRPGDFEGAASVAFTLTDDHWHDLVFADGGTALPTEPMSVPSAVWYFAAELPDGTTEPRTPTGAIVIDAEVTYQRNQNIQVELTMLFGYEPDDIDAPETIEKPSAEDVYTYHGADLDVDGVGQTLLQSTTLSLSNLARFRRGQDRHPHDAVTGAIEPELQSDSTFTERDQLDIALSGHDESAATIDKVDGELTFENGNGETIEYKIEGMQPTNYTWGQLVDPDDDLSEPATYHVTGVEVL